MKSVDRAEAEPRHAGAHASDPDPVPVPVPDATADALTALAWPRARLGEALHAVARHTGKASLRSAPPRLAPDDEADLERWLTAAAEAHGLAVDPLAGLHRDLEGALAAAAPALLAIGEGRHARYLAVVAAPLRHVLCLAPDGALHRVARAPLAAHLAAPVEAPHRQRLADLLTTAGIPAARRRYAEDGLIAELVGRTTALRGFTVRLAASAPFAAQVKEAGLLRLGAGLAAAHLAQYALFLLAWWAIGRAILSGSVASGWLWAWALLLLIAVPLAVRSTSLQGELGLGLGALLRRRLLEGALRLSPELVHKDGIGGLLGRTIEVDSMERLAIAGGFHSALAALELCLSALVLAATGGTWHVALLAAAALATAAAAARLARARFAWTAQRVQLTSLTVERMLGHRTRLAQEVPERWHDGEDEALAGYLGGSQTLDRRALALLVIAPRAWLLAGIAATAPAFLHGSDAAALAGTVGGVVLAWASLGRLSGGLDQLASAYVAWRNIAPLFAAGAADVAAAAATVEYAPAAAPDEAPDHHEPAIALEVAQLAFRHPGRAVDVLRDCSFTLQRGDCALLQGPSGGGKSTLISLLTGEKVPSSGLVLAGGFDRHSLGEVGWQRRVTSAPQFHQNHVLTETLAFNLLLGRGWPPRPEDLDEAEAVCDELGLGPLLQRMPAGIQQMIGETGWQLSHGEKSRLFIARALLQRCEVVILDESFAALDPDTTALALRCAKARARSLIVVAHP